jgi:hypothetical protein
VNVEFRVTVSRDNESPGVMANPALTVVQRAMTVEGAWGGDRRQVTNSDRPRDYADRSAVGACVCAIRRRYGYDDPCDQYPTWRFESDHWRPAGSALDGRNRPLAVLGFA